MTGSSTAARARDRRLAGSSPVLAVLTAATFWTVTAEMLPSGLLPLMSQDLGVSSSAIGTMVSAWAITIAVVGTPLVRLTLRFSRAGLLVVSLAITALANLLTSLAPGFVVAMTGRVIAAAGHGVFWALVVSYVATVVNSERLGRALSIVLAGPSLAGLVGLPVATLIAEHIGWRAVFAVLSAALIFTAVALRIILPRSVATPERQGASGSWDRSARAVLFVAAGGGLVLVGHFAAFTYVTSLVTGLAGLDASAIPVILLVLGGTGGVGVVLSGFVTDHRPRVALVSAAGLIAVGLVLVLAGEGRVPLFVIGTAVWGLAIGALPPILQARVLRVSTHAFRSLAGSVIITALNLGIAIGATIGGFVLRAGERALVLTAVVAAVGGTITLMLSARRDPGGASPSPATSARTS